MSWSDEIDEIIGGDLAVMLAYVTPAGGAVLSPMVPLGIRDREAGTVTLSSSLGLWKKLARLRANPVAAVAYHAREHGFSSRPEFVLVQGRVEVTGPDREWLESITPAWERFLGPRERGWRGRLMDAYYWQRVAIELDVERILIWPDAHCEGEPEVIGAELPAAADPQRPPAKRTAARVGLGTLERAAGRVPHTLLGWVGGDGLPVMVSAAVDEREEEWARLRVGASLLPGGGRRAGLTSHSFSAGVTGQDQTIHTGWLEVDWSSGSVCYAPHTRAGHRLPSSRLLYDLASGIVTRRGLGAAKKAGLG